MTTDTILKPLFTIITVTLNPGLQDLLETVNSVLDQEYSDWELIIKDGGSTDGSLSCLPKDGRIKVFKKKDSGIFDAMNQAMKHATGEFICFLNAGDFFYDDKALSVVTETHFGHPEAVFLYGNVYKPYSRSGYELYPARLSRFYLFKHMICHQAWFVRTSYYENSENYKTDFPSGADYHFFLKMLLVDRVKYQRIPEVLVTYKGGGVSQNPDIMSTSKTWIDELRRELFPGLEFSIYLLVWRTRDLLKKLLYDPLLYKGLRYLRKNRQRY